MKQQPLRAVFFDVGGTLLRPHPSIGAVYATVGERHGFVAGVEEWERAFRTAWERARAVGGASLTTAEKPWWRMLVFHALESLKLRGDDAAGDRFFEDLFAAFARADAWKLYPGVVEVLQAVRVRGLHVGAISNWDSRLRPLLKALGLEERFDSITVSCEVKAEKPAPEIFRAALRSARVNPVEALHVGDSQDEDVRGARAVGMRAVLIDREGKQQCDCLVISNLTGVLGLLRDSF